MTTKGYERQLAPTSNRPPAMAEALLTQAWAILHANDSCDHTMCRAPDPRNLDRSCLAQRIADALAGIQAGALVAAPLSDQVTKAIARLRMDADADGWDETARVCLNTLVAALTDRLHMGAGQGGERMVTPTLSVRVGEQMLWDWHGEAWHSSTVLEIAP